MKTHHFLALLYLIVLVGCHRIDGTEMTIGDYAVWTLAGFAMGCFICFGKRGWR